MSYHHNLILLPIWCYDYHVYIFNFPLPIHVGISSVCIPTWSRWIFFLSFFLLDYLFSFLISVNLLDISFPEVELYVNETHLL